MDGTTKVWGLIADPVEHSMSPLMQNFYAERTGVNGVYVPFKVEGDRVEEALRGAFALNIQGLNVTVPHKQRVMEHLDYIHEDARAIGAVNTLVRTEKGYGGYNTDGAGLKRAMDEAGISPEGRACILLGAGGAAKAAACVLAKGGARQIYILNRRTDRAGELAEAVNRMTGRETALALALDDYIRIPDIEEGYLAVQSTSVGMHPHDDEVILEDPAFYRKISEAVDVVYTPARTRFMKLVEEAGGRAINGLDMLLYQGIIAYELWHPGIRVDQETIDMARQMILERLEPGENLIFTGFMGAGKTSVGQEYASRYGLPFVDTDQEIEKEAGMPIKEIFARQGEEAFRQLETEVLKKLLKKKMKAVISVGGGLPLRKENKLLLRRLGTVVYLDVSPWTVYKRIGADVASRPMLQGGDVMERICSLLEKRRPVYLEGVHLVVDVNGLDAGGIAEEIYGLCHKRT